MLFYNYYFFNTSIVKKFTTIENIFKKNQTALQWAQDRIQYSNINLIIGNVENIEVDNEEALRYKADGLYTSENVVVVKNDSIYLFVGQYQDENSQIRKGFRPIVVSMRFID